MKTDRLLAALVLLALLSGCAGSPPPSGSSREEPAPSQGPYLEIPQAYRAWDASGANREHTRMAAGQEGIVSSLKYEASAIGARILSQGGNAADAAVAVSFALSVCEPYDSGPGGGGMALYHDSATGETRFFNFRETAPAGQTGLPEGEGKEALPLQIGTPGLVQGLFLLWEQYGSLPWSRLVEPSVQLARQGFQVTPAMLSAIELIYGELAGSGEAAQIYLRDDLPPRLGDILRNEPLARVLERIGAEGPDAFCQGDVARAMVSSARKAGSPLSLEDLSDYAPLREEPARGSYRGFPLVSSPCGGSCMIEALNLLEQLPVHPHGSVEQLSQMAEVQKLVFADRAAWLGDSRFVDLPLSGLTSKDYAAGRVPELAEGTPGVYGAGQPWGHPAEEENTSGFVIADRQGNVISVTQTLNGYWGSHVYVEGCGFFMNNELNDFDREPGRANSLEPGKSPLSSMSPTILFTPEGAPALALSAPGGLMIWPALVQVIQNRIDYHMTLDDALNAPRICTSGEFFYCDRDLPASAWEGLQALGYSGLTSRLSIARPSGLLLDGNHVQGSADRRGDAVIFSDCAALEATPAHPVPDS